MVWSQSAPYNMQLVYMTDVPIKAGCLIFNMGHYLIFRAVLFGSLRSDFVTNDHACPHQCFFFSTKAWTCPKSISRQQWNRAIQPRRNIWPFRWQQSQWSGLSLVTPLDSNVLIPVRSGIKAMPPNLGWLFKRLDSWLSDVHFLSTI